MIKRTRIVTMFTDARDRWHQATLHERLAAAVCVAFMLAIQLMPHHAHAQAAGAFLNGAINWMQTAVITSLATLAVIVLGIILMMLRFSLGHAAMICAGIWIAFNAAMLAGLLHA